MKPFPYLAYYWHAEYKDGNTFSQFDSEREHYFKEIDFKNLLSLSWVPQDSNRKSFTVKTQDGKEIIIFRKNFLSLINGSHKFAFIIGYKNEPLTWIFEDETFIAGMEEI